MPSVRTDSAPLSVPNITAIRIATGTVSHHGQPRLISATALEPKIATM
jgi:hypothetical protein